MHTTGLTKTMHTPPPPLPPPLREHGPMAALPSRRARPQGCTPQVEKSGLRAALAKPKNATPGPRFPSQGARPCPPAPELGYLIPKVLSGMSKNWVIHSGALAPTASAKRHLRLTIQ